MVKQHRLLANAIDLEKDCEPVGGGHRHVLVRRRSTNFDEEVLAVMGKDVGRSTVWRRPVDARELFEGSFGSVDETEYSVYDWHRGGGGWEAWWTDMEMFVGER